MYECNPNKQARGDNGKQKLSERIRRRNLEMKQTQKVNHPHLGNRYCDYK